MASGNLPLLSVCLLLLDATGASINVTSAVPTKQLGIMQSPARKVQAGNTRSAACFNNIRFELPSLPGFPVMQSDTGHDSSATASHCGSLPVVTRSIELSD